MIFLTIFLLGFEFLCQEILFHGYHPNNEKTYLVSLFTIRKSAQDEAIGDGMERCCPYRCSPSDVKCLIMVLV